MAKKKTTKSRAKVQKDKAKATPKDEASERKQCITRAEIVKAMADVGGVSRARAELMLFAMCDKMKETLGRGDIFRLPRGLGNFRLLHRNARQCRNPRTGETFTSPAGLRIRYIRGDAIKELENAESKAA